MLTDSNPKCAVLLHGLGRSSWSMNKVARQLRKSNYVVWNESYPSTSKTIEELAPIIDDALAFCREQNASGVYFVTHSLGGILVRQYFQTASSEMVKAVVMLAPPNHGSEVVDAYKDSWWFQWYTGAAGQQLGTDPMSVPNTLGPISVPVGVIAGTSSSDPWFSGLFKGENDGKVSVESAQLPGMQDFLMVEEGHTFIMNSNDVIEQILFFFENGHFQKDEGK
ncbi:MAG: alpha/beta fold hydrolase [Bdellovibrionaceae bacterium]|nr:alpha/beta fold hydrolase [Pseudobdellovibrionaceae bacterium]